MGRSHNTGGARALLFERLVDLELERKEESPPFRVLTRRELWESVRRELGQLLNTRCPVPLSLLGEEERTVINYGIPDFTSLSPQSAHDRKLIADIISQTITAFEPRLRNVRVGVENYKEDERTLQVTVEADLLTDAVIEIRSYPEFGSSLEPVTFPIVLDRKTGILEVHENEQ
jgi:type VI secretion system protein ImpF